MSSERMLKAKADQQGVPVARLKSVLAARKKFRDGRMYRARSRGRTLERNPKAKRYTVAPRRYAGEGELHALLREAGMSEGEFCALSGIAHSTFRQWYGHPLHMMPVELLRQWIWARNMAEFIQARGWDPEKFKAKGLPAAKGGNYVRNAEQAARMFQQPTEVLCPVHGRQKAMGGECPKC